MSRGEISFVEGERLEGVVVEVLEEGEGDGGFEGMVGLDLGRERRVGSGVGDGGGDGIWDVMD